MQHRPRVVPPSDQHRRAGVVELTYKVPHVENELLGGQSAANDVVEPHHDRGQFRSRSDGSWKLMPPHVPDPCSSSGKIHQPGTG